MIIHIVEKVWKTHIEPIDKNNKRIESFKQKIKDTQDGLQNAIQIQSRYARTVEIQTKLEKKAREGKRQQHQSTSRWVIH